MARFLQTTTLIVLVVSAVTSVFGSPLVENGLVARQDVQNIVYVTDANKFWWVDCVFSPGVLRPDCLTVLLKYDHAEGPTYQHRR